MIISVYKLNRKKSVYKTSRNCAEWHSIWNDTQIVFGRR